MAPTRSRPARARPFRRAVGEEQKDQRRDQILAAAKRVFAKKGFPQATIGEVAKAAGLAYGSVYWYFDSKDELFQALMRREEAELREHIAGVLEATSGDGETTFRVAVRATLEFFEADRAAVQLLFRDSVGLGGGFGKQLAGIYESFVDDVEAMIRDSQSAGEIVAFPPRLVAFSVASLIGQMALRRLTIDDGVSTEAAADFVVDLLLDGLRPRE